MKIIKLKNEEYDYIRNIINTYVVCDLATKSEIKKEHRIIHQLEDKFNLK